MKHILVVDDEPTVVRVLRLALEKAGYEVTKANNGEEALEHIHERVPDAVITDIEMPRLDGEGLCRRIEEEMPDRTFPLFVVTSLTAMEHRRWSDTIPNLHFLEKPISARRLLARLSEYFGTAKHKALSI
jgi:CheY-like chemotaxis protein